MQTKDTHIMLTGIAAMSIRYIAIFEGKTIKKMNEKNMGKVKAKEQASK